jgi:hypothetical protein
LENYKCIGPNFIWFIHFNNHHDWWVLSDEPYSLVPDPPISRNCETFSVRGWSQHSHNITFIYRRTWATELRLSVTNESNTWKMCSLSSFCSHNLDLETTTQTFMLLTRSNPLCVSTFVKHSSPWCHGVSPYDCIPFCSYMSVCDIHQS